MDRFRAPASRERGDSWAGCQEKGRNLVPESEAELLLLAKGGVEALCADEDGEDDDGDEESDEL